MSNDNKSGYKKTKLGLIPDEWEIINFGDAFDFIKSYSLSRSKLTNEKMEKVIYNIHYGDIHARFKSSLLDLSNSENELPKIAEDLDKIASKDFLKEGDLIIADASEDYEGVCASIEIVNIGNKNVTGGLHTFVARSRTNIFKDGYKGYIFKHNQVSKTLKKIATGISVYGVSKTNLSKVQIPLPPLPEQKKIAQILSTWDKAIEQTQALLTQLQFRKKGLMQQLLTGKTRLKGFEGEWEELRLGNFFTERKERGFNDLELLSVGKNGVYPQDNSNKKDTSNSDKSKYKKVCVGDIAYNTMRMWQGRSALSTMEGIVSPAYTIIKSKENSDPDFFSYLFKLEEMIHKFYRNSQGMVSDTWMCKFKDFSIIKIQAPPTIEEQKAISDILKSADAEMHQLEKHLTSLQTQKKGLMQQLLTGQKRVELN